MTDGRFTSETGRKAGKASARRKLTLEHVEQELGDLHNPRDAERWLQKLTILAVSGRVAGTVLNGAVRAVEIWLRVKEAEASFEVVEALRADVRELREERDQFARDLELARMGIR